MIDHANLKKLVLPALELETVLWTETPVNLVGFTLCNGRVICGQIGESDETALLNKLREKAKKWSARKLGNKAKPAPTSYCDINKEWQTIRCDLPSGKIVVSPGYQSPLECRRLIQAVIDYFAGRRFEFSDIPLDLDQTTDFTRKVWDQCRGISYGATITYGQLAVEVGRPRAVRAVAQALAHNPIPILIPCHRVIAADGSLCGFSAPGGTDTKRKLLLMEREFYATYEPRTQSSS
ncbi:MAG: methylated-DNA--[protein]-cysteine S-methyltransferase [Thermogutta sp.]